METQAIKTDFRKKKEARELAIYHEYSELMSQPEAMSTAVNRYLKEKYGFGADSTIWCIRQRVAKRLKKEGKL